MRMLQNTILVLILNLSNVLVFTYTCTDNNIKSFIDEYNVNGIVTN